MKHVPMRTCIVCREVKDKSQLIRIVARPDGSFAADGTGRLEGRGAYVCKSPDCVRALAKKRALDRAFKSRFDSETYDNLTNELIGQIDNGQ